MSDEDDKVMKPPFRLSEGTYQETAMFRRGFLRASELNRRFGLPEVPMDFDDMGAGFQLRENANGETEVYFPNPEAHSRLVASLRRALAEVGNGRKNGPK
jgi:hypothetical protein